VPVLALLVLAVLDQGLDQGLSSCSGPSSSSGPVSGRTEQGASRPSTYTRRSPWACADGGPRRPLSQAPSCRAPR